MRRCVITLLAVLAVISVGTCASASDDENTKVTTPSKELVKKLSEAILKHSPDAKIEITKEGFFAKDGTMMFTIHGRSKTGEVSRETGQQEGPNYKGFMLRVSLEEGTYSGAAAIPQTLQGPYFPTFIDGPATDDGKNYHRISFSYGSRLDPKLKQAILEAIPKTKFAVPDPSK